MNPLTTAEGIAWRPAFALRMFTLALLIGTLARNVRLVDWAFTAVMLAVVGLTASVVHLKGSPRSIGFVPLLEATVCVVLLSASPGANGLLAYLAVPPLAAGLTTGAVRAASSGVVTVVALAAASLSPGGPLSQDDAWTGAAWAFVGVLAGLIASWQTRADRAVSARQGHALRGRNLLTEFETTLQSPEALDFEEQARRALDQLLVRTNAVGGKVVLTDGVQTRSLATSGADPEALDLATECAGVGHLAVRGRLVGVPLRGLQGNFGAAVLRSPMPWSTRESKTVESLVNELAIPLDAALIFAQVTERATAAERSRLARDIHDTVAQDVASLGYLVDALARSSEDPAIGELVANLRAEITRIVGQLRYSIFELRAGELALAAAITSHARQAADRAGLRLHLDLDPVQLSEGQEHWATHVQRIAQEAVTNTARHAHARNLWVRLHCVGEPTRPGLRLEVEDDGIGMSTRGVASGFGLASMRERADALGARLEHGSGQAGGTVVRLELSEMPMRPEATP